MPIKYPMMVFIRKKFRKGNIYYYIVENKREGSKVHQKVLYYIGTIKTLIKKLKIADEVLKQKKD